MKRRDVLSYIGGLQFSFVSQLFDSRESITMAVFVWFCPKNIRILYLLKSISFFLAFWHTGVSVEIAMLCCYWLKYFEGLPCPRMLEARTTDTQWRHKSKNLKFWADVADKVCFGRTKKFGIGIWFSAVQS
jgi:hypothetical protein